MLHPHLVAIYSKAGSIGIYIRNLRGFNIFKGWLYYIGIYIWNLRGFNIFKGWLYR